MSLWQSEPRPRTLHLAPGAVHNLFDRGIELCEMAGVYLDDWQKECLRHMLGLTKDGLWAAYEYALIVPRQNGKGEVIVARELIGLFLIGEPLIMHSAHEFKTAAEGFLRIKGIIQNCPELDAEVANYRTSHGDEAIELKKKKGQKEPHRLRFVARSRSSGRGFTGDCLILDEAYSLSASEMSALLYTLSAVPNAQICYFSSAPLVESSQLRLLRRRAKIQSDQELCVIEYAADPKLDITKPDERKEAVRQANPALGIRIQLRTTEMEFRTSEDDLPGYGRERLGWGDGDDAAGGEINLDQWAALGRCAADCDQAHDHEKSEIKGTPIFGLDVQPERKWASFAAYGPRSDEISTHIEVVDRRPDTDWVLSRGIALAAKHGAPIAIETNSPAATFIEKLRKAGVTVIEVTERQRALACATMVDEIKANRMFHVPQPSLDRALANSGKRILKDLWVFSRKSETVDTSALGAVVTAIAATEVEWDHDRESIYNRDDGKMKVLG